MLWDLQRIVDLDAGVAHRAPELGLRELDRPEVLRVSVYQRRVRPWQRVGAVVGEVEPDQGHPPLDDPGVQAGREISVLPVAAGEEEARAARLPRRIEVYLRDASPTD